MGEETYQEFLDWARRASTRVVLKLEDGTVLAEGVRPRSEAEEHDAKVRVAGARTAQVIHLYSLGLLRRWHGDEAVEGFIAAQRAAIEGFSQGPA